MNNPLSQTRWRGALKRRVVHFMLWLMMIGCVFLVTGCAGGVHSFWSTRAQTEARLLTATNYPAYSGKVFLTEGGLAANQPVQAVAQLDAGTAEVLPTEAVLEMLVDKACEVGANAVIHVRIWRQVSVYTRNAPHGCGLAIRLFDTNALSGLNGYWR